MQCGFEAKAPTKEEPLLKVGMHASKVHNMESVPPDVLKSINRAIKL
jgi:predicted small metal-binding protein